MVEVSLNREGGLGGRGGGDLGSPQDLGDFLFLARSSQPGSIGHELQQRGIRFFPKEAFVDVGFEEALTSPAVTDEVRYSWETGTPLPREKSMNDLPRDEQGRVRLVLWDPSGG